MVSCDFSGIIKLWNPQLPFAKRLVGVASRREEKADQGSTREYYRDIGEHSNSVWSVTFSTDGKWLVSASYDETIKIWSVATGECLQTFVGYKGPILNAKFSYDERFIISIGVDRSLKIWDIETGKCLHSLTEHSGLIYTLDLGNIRSSEMDYPKFIAFTGSLDETIKVWDLEAAKCLATWKSRRPYEGMSIDKTHGLTRAQKASLRALGAIRNGTESYAVDY